MALLLLELLFEFGEFGEGDFFFLVEDLGYAFDFLNLSMC